MSPTSLASATTARSRRFRPTRPISHQAGFFFLLFHSSRHQQFVFAGPGEVKIGLAFNYVPGDEDQVPEIRRHGLKTTPSSSLAAMRDQEEKSAANGRQRHETAQHLHVIHNFRPAGENDDDNASLKEFLQIESSNKGPSAGSSPSVLPKVVKTTTKETFLQSADGVVRNKQETIQDLTSGPSGRPFPIITSSSSNKVHCGHLSFQVFII